MHGVERRGMTTEYIFFSKQMMTAWCGLVYDGREYGTVVLGFLATFDTVVFLSFFFNESVCNQILSFQQRVCPLGAL